MQGCHPSIPPEEFLGPSGPKLEAELIMSSRGLPAPGSKKRSRKRVKKWKFQLFFNLFDSFSTPFLTFGTLGPEGPGNSFSTPFPTLGPKGPRTPLGGCKGRKCRGIYTVRVKIITGSLVTLENLFPENYRYRYRLEIRMNYHYRYRLGICSHPFISIDSQLPP